MPTRQKTIWVAIGAIAALSATSAMATVATGTLAVSMTVQATCTVTSTSAVAFGTSGLLTANTDATGTVVVACTNSTPYTVSLDQGAASGATTTTRKMTAGAATISYNLYRDSGRTQNWGNTIGTDTVAGTGNGTSQSLTVYGRVPAQTTPAPGAYADTVNVTITY